MAELLVVVAIIAILVAVSIPIFSGKLTEARKNTDLANVRAAKAAGITQYLSEGISGKWFFDAENGVLVNDKAKIKDGYNQLQTRNGENPIKPKKGIIAVVLGGYKDQPKVHTYWDDVAYQ